MTTQPVNISVTLPVSQALDRVKRVLFQPFDLGKWFVIGFCAWLAYLGKQGFHGSFNFNAGNRHGRQELRHQFDAARDFVMHNLYWIMPVAVAVVVIGIALGVVFLWLSSRGRFMFLHCVALDRAEVAEPWRAFVHEGNSLFWFRLVLSLISALPILPLMILLGVSLYRMLSPSEPDLRVLPLVVGTLLAFLAAVFLFALIQKLTRDFVVPIMFLRRGRCLAAWREFLGLLRMHPGEFVLYLLFQIVLALAIGVIVLVVVLATCCIAGCLLAIPYLGTVLLLPILVFKRSYSLHYLAQYGPQFDVFPPSPGAPPVPGGA
jgi:hypothetical protein